MSTSVEHASGPGHPALPVTAPAFGRLYAVELRRFFARRFMRITLLLAVLGYLLMAGLSWHQHHRVTPADIAQATRQRDETLAEIRVQIGQCAKSVPVGEADDRCGTVPTDEDFPIDGFLANHPMTPKLVSDTALALGVAIAALGFVLGATFIGAEWSSRNIVAWLFWEPRRLRLLGAKVLALLSVMLALSTLTQLGWAVIGRFILHHRGLPVSSLGAAAHRFWPELATLQVRAGLLVLASSLLAFGLAQLLRNTAAAFGFGFLYFAVIETAVRAIRPQWTPYLLTQAIGAWTSRGGVNVYLSARLNRQTGEYVEHVVHLSNRRGGVTLLIYVAIVAVLMVVTFRRREIS